MTTASLMTAWLQLLALLAAEVGLIALEVALLQRASPRAAWRRTFCQAGLTAVLVVTLCELSGSARVLGGWVANAAPWRRSDRPTAQNHAPQPGPTISLLRNTREDAPTPEVAAPERSAPVLGRSNAGIGYGRGNSGALEPPVIAAPEDGRSPPAPAASPPPETVSDSMGVLWLWLAWAVGAALAAGRACLAQCLFMIFHLRRRSVPALALAQRVQTLARALGIRRRVSVVESARLTSPIAFGVVRPTVGLPAGFAARYDVAKQEAMLAHELAHLAAHDPFWCLLADFATVALWWHPGVWWLRRQLHLASEMAADEASLLVADGPRVLAECLVELGARLTGPVPLGQLRMAGFRSHLGRRVQQLLHLEGRAWSPPPPLAAALMRIFGPMVMTIIVVFCTAWVAPQALTKGDSMKTMQLNWKRSLATFALLAAFNGPEAPVAAAQSDKPEPPATPAPAVVPAPEVAPAPPAAPASPGASSEQARVFRARYGVDGSLGSAPPAGLPGQAAKPARGSKVEAKLNQIILPVVGFDGLPLSEVLHYLSDESVKRDPDKTGVNFLINPNNRPVSFTGAIDPATGLPLASPQEPIDVASVFIRFNLPLRNVTMKDVLDAIVTVADHPLEYSVENYGVVFAAKPEMLNGAPVLVTPPGSPAKPAPEPQSQLEVRPEATHPANPLGNQIIVARPGKSPQPNVEEADAKPETFNVDFGSGRPSEQIGPAAAGRPGDLWNGVAVPFNDHHTESELQFADGDPSPITVEMINLGGCWHFDGTMGVKAPMLDHYNYPTGNRGGNSTVILHHVPAGKYVVYIYGHGPDAPYYGDYTLTVGDHDYGRKQTTHKAAGHYTKWVEGIQYVKFTNVKVGRGDAAEILIQPGAPTTDYTGRTFRDAMICGLQLIPADAACNDVIQTK